MICVLPSPLLIDDKNKIYNENNYVLHEVVFSIKKTRIIYWITIYRRSILLFTVGKEYIRNNPVESIKTSWH